MICNNCGQNIDGTFCTYCGSKVSDKNKCESCGIEFDGNFCPSCGNGVGASTVHAPHQQPTIVINNSNQNANFNGGYPGISQKSKWVAAILCLLGGFFGIHRFYVGKIGTGLVWLFSGGLFGFGWIIDLIMILCGGFRDGYGLMIKN